MKKTISAIMSVFLVASIFVGCTKTDEAKNFSVMELKNKMVDEGYVIMPGEVDETMAKEIFHINSDDVEEYAIAETMRSPGNDLIVMMKAKKDKVDNVKAIAEQILKDKTGKAFYPQEQEAAARAKVTVDGQYVSLFILHEDVETDAMKMYNEALGKTE